MKLTFTTNPKVAHTLEEIKRELRDTAQKEWAKLDATLSVYKPGHPYAIPFMTVTMDPLSGNFTIVFDREVKDLIPGLIGELHEALKKVPADIYFTNE